MIIIASALMGPGTFEAKFVPLSKVQTVDTIYVLRKMPGPPIEKVQYIILPRICKFPVFHLIIAPFLLVYHSYRKKADLIISYHIIPHAFFAYIASILARRPFIAAQTGLYIQHYAGKKIVGPIIVKILKNASFLNVPGTSSKKFWISQGVSANKINILHSTIDTDTFYPNNIPKKYDFIFLGRLAKVKRIDLLLEGFLVFLKQHKNANMVIVGDGPEYEDLMSLTIRLNISQNVLFTGFQKNTEEWLKKSKIFLMASKSEGLPVSLMEAMSTELSAVVPDVGNIPDLIDGDYLINPVNRETILHGMLRAYDNYDIDETTRKCHRTKIINNYSHRCAVEQWNELLSAYRGAS